MSNDPKSSSIPGKTAGDTDSPIDSRHPFLYVLPPEIIDAWFKGEYAFGTGSRTTYNELGWMLMARGFYHYKVQPGDMNLSNGGCCIIDFQDGELCTFGLRLYNGRKYKGKTPKVPSLWHSVFSKMITTASGTDLYTAYRLYKKPSNVAQVEFLDRAQKLYSMKGKIDNDIDLNKALTQTELSALAKFLLENKEEGIGMRSLEFLVGSISDINSDFTKDEVFKRVSESHVADVARYCDVRAFFEYLLYRFRVKLPAIKGNGLIKVGRIDK